MTDLSCQSEATSSASSEPRFAALARLATLFAPRCPEITTARWNRGRALADERRFRLDAHVGRRELGRLERRARGGVCEEAVRGMQRRGDELADRDRCVTDHPRQSPICGGEPIDQVGEPVDFDLDQRTSEFAGHRSRRRGRSLDTDRGQLGARSFEQPFHAIRNRVELVAKLGRTLVDHGIRVLQRAHPHRRERPERRRSSSTSGGFEAAPDADSSDGLPVADAPQRRMTSSGGLRSRSMAALARGRVASRTVNGSVGVGRRLAPASSPRGRVGLHVTGSKHAEDERRGGPWEIQVSDRTPQPSRVTDRPEQATQHRARGIASSRSRGIGMRHDSQSP